MSARTTDPWAAFEAAGDPVRHALRLAQLNERARSGRRVGGDVRSVVDRSWQRSAAAGVDDSVGTSVMLCADGATAMGPGVGGASSDALATAACTWWCCTTLRGSAAGEGLTILSVGRATGVRSTGGGDGDGARARSLGRG